MENKKFRKGFTPAPLLPKHLPVSIGMLNKFLNSKLPKHTLRESGAGFTLVELIIVIAVIALLAAAVFVAVDPAKRIGQAQDAQRWSDVTAIADAILNYVVDNSGTFPTSTTSFTAGTKYPILTGSDNRIAAANLYGICPTLASAEPLIPFGLIGGVDLSDITPTYLPTMATDPTLTATSTVGYWFSRSSAGRVTIGSCVESDYATASITVTR